MAGKGIRAVEYDDRFARFMAGLHAEFQRPDEGVVAAAHVLQVDHERIDIGEHLRPGFSRFSVQAVNRQARTMVAKTLPLDHVVLRLTEDAVLGAEERGELKLPRSHADGDRMFQSAVDRGGMHYKPDTRAFEVTGPARVDEIEAGESPFFPFQHGQIILTLTMNSNRKFIAVIEKPLKSVGLFPIMQP